MINYTDKALHYLGKTNAPVQTLSIGAMDGVTFDDFAGYISMYNFPTLFVEPMAEMFRRLTENIKGDKHKFENSAISDYDGEIEMLSIDTNVIDQKLIHECFYGMSAVYPPKNGLGSEGDRATVEKYGYKLKVPCLTLESLLKKHNITSIDVFKTDVEGHDWHIFKQLDLEKYRPKLIYLEWINLSNEEQNSILEVLEAFDYVHEIVGANIAAVPKEFAETIINYFSPKPEPTPPAVVIEPPTKQNTTIVTGLWDLGRGNLQEGFGRSFDHYLQKFEELLKADIYMYVHVPKELEQWVMDRRDMSKTRIRCIEVEEFRNWFAFYKETNSIRQKPEWYNFAGWLPNSPQARLEFYNPIVMSKMFLLNDTTIFNPFNTDYFFWIDGGITNTVHWGYFQKDRVFDNLDYYYEIQNKFLYLTYPYTGNEEIHGFKREGMNKYCGVSSVDYVCRGGFFGGRKDHINSINNLYYNYLQNSLREGYMGTEESIFTIIAHKHDELVQQFRIGDDGLVWPFFEELKNIRQKVKVTVRGKKPFSETKVSSYAITFNIPEQFLALNESFEKADKNFIDRPRKVLLNNSTDRSTDEAYRQLCERYGWEEVKKDNLGICRGRQWCAEHFAESDSDLMFFWEDDMFTNAPTNELDSFGFKRYIDNLYERTIKIAHEEDYDFIKLNFTELYMANNRQVSWYNVPQHIREQYFPEKTKLPVQGLDPNTPYTKFNNIKSIHGITLVDGFIYYCNWPHIITRRGNQKVFLDTTWAYPWEGTTMSYVFQEQHKNNIKSAIYLMSPITHTRVRYYEGKDRREN